MKTLSIYKLLFIVLFILLSSKLTFNLLPPVESSILQLGIFVGCGLAGGLLLLTLDYLFGRKAEQGAAANP